MKSFIQNLWNNNTLYKKECKIICAVLFCFALSGICLPTVKEQLLTKDSVENQIAVSTLPEDQIDTAKIRKFISSNDASESKENVADDDATKETTEETESTVPATDSSNNTSTNTAPQKPVSNNNENTTSGTTSPPPATSEPPSETEKVWVPPVYTTVHHPAVYETIQMVCCNYCGATFGSVGEFQVHKDANGG